MKVQRHCEFCWVLRGAGEAEHQPDECRDAREGLAWTRASGFGE
jgi:hypothetical protein